VSHRTVAQILESARTEIGLSNRDLWIGCYGLGGHHSPQDLDTYLDGSVLPARAEYDLLAQTLNDHFVDVHLDHLVPYAEDLDLFPPLADV
jgi:hypothetical protein